MSDTVRVPSSAEGGAAEVAGRSGVVLASRAAAAGNGYTTLLTSRGGGSAAYAGVALTGWTGSWLAAGDGPTIWIRDAATGAARAVGGGDGDRSAVLRTEPGRATLLEERDGLGAELTVCVAPDAPLELRRLTLTNGADEPHRLEVISCVEVVLHDPRAHAAHPVFSKLFLQTERDPATGALLVHRRPRGLGDSWPWMVHACRGGRMIGFETDRARFIGRGSPAGRPAALTRSAPLSGTLGNVLDPVLCFQCGVELAPHAAASVVFMIGAAPDRSAALALVERAGDTDAVLAAAQTTAEALRRRHGLSEPSYMRILELGAAAACGDASLRAPDGVLERAAGSPRALLARLGLDPDRPLAVVDADAGAAHLETATAAARIWSELGLPIQLAVVGAGGQVAEPGIVPIARDVLAAEEYDLLAATARLVVAEHLPSPSSSPRPTAVAAQARTRPPADSDGQAASAGDARRRGDDPLVFANQWGGFAADGDEYVIRLRRDRGGRLDLPPQPWVNVIANDRFGCLVSETGAGSTWAGNSREHRLTPWFNDPVRDPHGDALLVREGDSVFSCLPGPVPGDGEYELRHGFGYTRCRYHGSGLDVDTRVFVAREDPVRVDLVRVTNVSERPRHISLACHRVPVLGDSPTGDGRFVVVERDVASGALFARNRTAGAYAHHVAFAASVADAGGAPADPPPIEPASPAPGAARIAHEVRIELAPGATAAVAFLLGEADDAAGARALLSRFSDVDACEAAWHESTAFWRDGLGALRVATPAPALDLLLNGWLAYQTLSCRLRARTAFYQSGGAYGYRDQLQDALALVPYWPERAREQILLNAAHQFVEGDVLHWWHPPEGRGLRTRFADDLLWLPLLTAQYVAATGDETVLAERVRYLEARRLAPGEDEAYVRPEPAGESGDVYDHCCRALDRSLTHGAHGLPLFGSGDWNDGMNRVGHAGAGESVWMGFFLVAVVDAFVPFCDARGDRARAERYRAYRKDLVAALDDAGWDGGYYLRGFYDDGTPLGSHRDDECRIDGLVQAWSVLAKVASPERARLALDAVEEYLISEDDRLIRLLTPPFVDTPRDPGYIKGYVAGVRENGGQYTHAALWVVRAMAQAGRRNRAARLLEMLSPIAHTETPEALARYQVEPYVIAADVYGAPPHVGRGGWTWYTGSSGWMLRVALESILGVTVEAGRILIVNPCLPDAWPRCGVRWRRPGCGTVYELAIVNPKGCTAVVVAATADGESLDVSSGVCRVPLVRDGETHHVEVVLGARGA